MTLWSNAFLFNYTKESIMTKKFLWIIAFAFSFVATQTVFADSWECGKGLKEMVASLKLEEAQKEKIKPILEQLKASMKNSEAQMEDLDKQIDQQVDAATVDQAAVNGLVDKKTKIIGDMIKAKITAKNQIAAVLTAPQKSELQNKMKKMEEKIAEKFKNCHD